MNGKREKRNRSIRLVVNDEEYQTIHNFYAESACRGIREYGRAVLLRKPVVIKCRNQSVEDLLSVMLEIKTELEIIGENFEKAVKTLQTLDSGFAMESWCGDPEHTPLILFSKIEEIRRLMNQYYQQCLQS